MHRLLRCPDCGRDFSHSMPDVSDAEAAQLRADNNEIATEVTCPHQNCRHKFLVRNWAIPKLPFPPP